MALDLTKDVPRSPFDQIEGFAWLPRLIDKARAGFAGTMGDYTPYPCPGDKNFLRYFGIDAQALGTLIKDGADDATIGAYVKSQTTRTPAEAETFARKLEGPSGNPVLDLVLWFFKRKLKPQFQSRYPGRRFSEINSFGKMIALEEGYPIPGF